MSDSEKNLLFKKFCGAGNDFIVFDEAQSNFSEKWSALFPDKSRSDVAKELCQRALNIGADGLVFLRKEGEGRFIWDFYNSDGSAAEMCGNAARCVGLYAHQEYGWLKVEIATRAGDVLAAVDRQKNVVVSMPTVTEVGSGYNLEFDGSSYEYDIVRTGVPHVVVTVRELNLDRLRPVARELRFPKDLDEQGANVTFIEKKQSYIKALTFERGVEDFTLACGTGAVAARWKMRNEFSLKQPLKVSMSGHALLVELKEMQAKTFAASLGGPARLVYEGQISIS